MKTTNTIIAITIILLAVVACKKAPELEEHKYHELIEGKSVSIMLYHNAGYKENQGSGNFLSRISKNKYQLDLKTGNPNRKIDTITLLDGTDKILLSKLKLTSGNDVHYECSFKNAFSVSEDSIYGEFYDDYLYNTNTRQWIPSHGTFAMKINK